MSLSTQEGNISFNNNFLNILEDIFNDLVGLYHQYFCHLKLNLEFDTYRVGHFVAFFFPKKKKEEKRGWGCQFLFEFEM